MTPIFIAAPAGLYALAAVKASDTFACRMSPVHALELDHDGAAVRVLHAFTEGSFIAVLCSTALDWKQQPPVVQCAGQLVYPSLREAAAALRDLHRQCVNERDGVPDHGAVPDRNFDPLTGLDDEDRARVSRPQHWDTPSRIEV